MKDNENVKKKLSELKNRVEKRKSEGYIYSSKKEVVIENSFFNDLKIEVYKTI